MDAAALRRALAPLRRSRCEAATVWYLDGAGELAGTRGFTSAAVTFVDISIRAVVVDALRLDAPWVILAHNHPSGNVEPSAQDLAFTRRLYATLSAIDIRLYDHLIVARTRSFSFRAAGLL